ncbi:MAG: ferrous iron transport protein A [Erysipelotrichaceae bacterium]|nr:ferrous iron transport protein A [Erysipelotrichaceae bacterium]MCI9524303.1 ferrous iron transport protein A [Erysipelotrichaceae bacterium]
MTLNEVEIGKTVTITKIQAASAVKKKLMDMGLTKHTPLRIQKIAPLGDPIHIHVRGYDLSIRKQDAACIEVV